MYTEPELAHVGMTDKAMNEQGIKYNTIIQVLFLTKKKKKKKKKVKIFVIY